MMYINVNSTIGPIRRETMNGREFFVAPLTSIVKGVLNGSRGALFYPNRHIRNSTPAWDDIPIVVYHPIGPNGQHVSAFTPGVLERQGVGFLRNSKFDGKLQHEAWVDVELAKKVDKRVYDKMAAGLPMEVSTGLHTEDKPKMGTYNGKPYSFIAKNYRPDHMAILPDQIGACSLNDGCGLGVNYTVNPAVSEAQRKYLNSQFGHAWVKEHGFDNKGKLPEKKEEEEEVKGNVLTRAFATLVNYLTIPPGGAAIPAPRAAGGKFGNKNDPDDDGSSDSTRTAQDDAEKTSQSDVELGNKALRMGISLKELKAKMAVNKAVKADSAEASSRVAAASDRMATNVKYERYFDYVENEWSDAARAAAIATRQAHAAEEALYIKHPNGAMTASKEEIQHVVSLHDKAADAHEDAWHESGGSGLKPKAESIGHEDHMEHHSQRAQDLRDQAHLTKNAKHERCPKCGGEMVDGECEECDYVENALGQGNWSLDKRSSHADELSEAATDDDGHKAAADAHAAAAKEAGGPSATGGEKDHALAGYHGYKAKWHEDQIGGTSNMKTNGGTHSLAGVDREQQKAAFSHMDKGSESGQAKEATSKAKERGTDEAHRAAGAAHKKAYEYHAAQGNDKQAAEHKAAWGSHMKAARKAPMESEVAQNRRQRMLTRLAANCSCANDVRNLSTLSTETLQALVANAPNFSDAKPDPKTEKAMKDRKKIEEDADEAPEAEEDDNTENWLRKAPKAVREVFNAAIDTVNGTKKDLVARLTANVTDPESRIRLTINLMNKDVNELKDLAAMLPPVMTRVPFLYGFNGDQTANTDDTSDDLLEDVTMNYEAYKKGGVA